MGFAGNILAYPIAAIFILILVTILLHAIAQYLEYAIWYQMERKAKLDSSKAGDRGASAQPFLQEMPYKTDRGSPRKLQNAKKKGKKLERLVLIGLLLSTIFLPVSFKVLSETQFSWMQLYKNKEPLTVLPSPTPVDEEVSYKILFENLKEKNWEAADKTTYKLLLKLAGEKSLARGYIDFDEFDKLSCEELKKIDSFWREASDGQQGFSAQQIIYNEQGQNWQRMYAKVKWAEWKEDILVTLVDKTLNWETRRLEYKPGMEPNFKNPAPGHLPVTIGLVRGKEFPQFAELCAF